MTNKLYQIDAFAEKVFSGNPAAVCPLDAWLPDELMQKIAMENNLAETVFYVKQGEQYHIRWFTPAVEVDLCGHATLAAAFVLFNYENHKENIIHFYSPRSGELTVTKNGEFLSLNFPTDSLNPVTLSTELLNCFEPKLYSAFKGKTDYLLVFDKEDDIINVTPAFDDIAKLDSRGVIITAKGNQVDFVSRFFAPQIGIKEDPVTGSAHTTLAPYWAKQLNKTEFSAIQLSERRGYLQCRYLNERTEISGKGKLYLIGEITFE
ncbi:MAG: PhzF family phenazine biosynthesis protein [Bacteroidales bacterium]|nr:PhzF family phenazine biosynthesis protein [Bacteroidales bacterium]